MAYEIKNSVSNLVKSGVKYIATAAFGIGMLCSVGYAATPNETKHELKNNWQEVSGCEGNIIYNILRDDKKFDTHSGLVFDKESKPGNWSKKNVLTKYLRQVRVGNKTIDFQIDNVESDGLKYEFSVPNIYGEYDNISSTADLEEKFKDIEDGKIRLENPLDMATYMILKDNSPHPGIPIPKAVNDNHNENTENGNRQEPEHFRTVF